MSFEKVTVNVAQGRPVATVSVFLLRKKKNVASHLTKPHIFIQHIFLLVFSKESWVRYET